MIHSDVSNPARSTSQFRQETLLAGDQQAHDLPLGDADTDGLQQRHQPLDRHLALMVLHQHEAAQFRAEMAAHAAGSGAKMARRLASPAFAAIAHRPRAQHESCTR